MVRKRRETLAVHRVVAIGLTGGIGAGKSTALALFNDLGALTFSADQIVHELYGRSEVATLVAEHFGRPVVSAQGTVDRLHLAEAVRGDREELRWLEQVVHPLVGQEIVSIVETAAPGAVVVCEVPLLFETGFEGLFDLVVTVEAPADVRRQRSIHKFGLGQFAEFEALQATSERRVAESDLAYVNEGGLDELREFVATVYQQAERMLASQGDGAGA